jgi:hypothetical protein
MPEDMARMQSRRFRPHVKVGFRPTGHGNGTNAVAFPPHIEDGPSPFPLLNVVKRQY